MVTDVMEAFETLRSKMAKISECYVSLATGYESILKYSDLDTASSSNERKDRLSSIYKYLSTMFSEWSQNCKDNQHSFDVILMSSNKHSLIASSSLYDVIAVESAIENQIRPGKRAHSRFEKIFS